MYRAWIDFTGFWWQRENASLSRLFEACLQGAQYRAALCLPGSHVSSYLGRPIVGLQARFYFAFIEQCQRHERGLAFSRGLLRLPERSVIWPFNIQPESLERVEQLLMSMVQSMEQISATTHR